MVCMGTIMMVRVRVLENRTWNYESEFEIPICFARNRSVFDLLAIVSGNAQKNYAKVM